MKPISRRQAIKIVSGVTAIVPLAMLTGRQVAAAELTPIDPADPMAKALEYVHESATEGQFCDNCQLYQGEADAEWGACPLFPGKAVTAKGWCKSWVKKAG